jgi:hypothetical protein
MTGSHGTDGKDGPGWLEYIGLIALFVVKNLVIMGGHQLNISKRTNNHR